MSEAEKVSGRQRAVREPAAPRKEAPAPPSGAPSVADLLALAGRGAGNHALARMLAADRVGQSSRPLLQRKLSWPGVVGDGPDPADDGYRPIALELAGGDAVLAATYVRLLTRFDLRHITNVINGLGVPRARVVRVERVLEFLEAGASEDDARYALLAAPQDADLFQLIRTMLAHPGRRAAIDWALKQAGIAIAQLDAYLADARALAYDMAVTDAYHAAAILPAYTVEQIVRVVTTLGVPVEKVARVGHVLGFLGTGATDEEAALALGGAAEDAELAVLLNVLLGHLGQTAAMQWALAKATGGAADVQVLLDNAKALGYDLILTGAYYADGILPTYTVAQIVRVVTALGVPVAKVKRVGLVLAFLDKRATDEEAALALDAAGEDADLGVLLTVLLDHLGQPAAMRWALAKPTGITLAAILLDHAKAFGYDTALTDAYYAAAVLPRASIADIERAVTLGAPRQAPVRVGLALRLLAAHASDPETTYALKVAVDDNDLQQLIVVMIPHLGQLAAIQWAVTRAGGDWVRAEADLRDAAALGYDTALVEWSRKTGSVEAENARQVKAAQIALDLAEREEALSPAVDDAKMELAKIERAWGKKKWTYVAGPVPKGTAKHNPPGVKTVQVRTEAKAAVTAAEAPLEKARTQAESGLLAAEAGKAATEQAFVDLVAAYVRAGVSGTDAQTLYAQLGGPGFQTLFKTFGADVGALVAGLGVPLVADYFLTVPAGAVKALVDHLTPPGVASLHTTLPRVSDVLELWTVFGTQLAPLIAILDPKLLYSLMHDHSDPLTRLFKASGGLATTLLDDIGRVPFEWLVRELKPSDIAQFLAGGVPSPRLAQIGQPSCIKTFAKACAADCGSLISLCNTPAVTTPQIVKLINLCSGPPTLARVVTTLGLARDAASLITILELQVPAGMSDTDVDSMLSKHAGPLAVPGRDIEHDVYFRLACRAQNEVYLDGPGLLLLLSPRNVHYPAVIAWVKDKHTSYDAPNQKSEMYKVSIPNPAGSGIAHPTGGWEIHLHREHGGTISSGSIKKKSQGSDVGPGVYRKALPMQLEKTVRSHHP